MTTVPFFDKSNSSPRNLRSPLGFALVASTCMAACGSPPSAALEPTPDGGLTADAAANAGPLDPKRYCGLTLESPLQPADECLNSRFPNVKPTCTEDCTTTSGWLETGDTKTGKGSCTARNFGYYTIEAGIDEHYRALLAAVRITTPNVTDASVLLRLDLNGLPALVLRQAGPMLELCSNKGSEPSRCQPGIPLKSNQTVVVVVPVGSPKAYVWADCEETRELTLDKPFEILKTFTSVRIGCVDGAGPAGGRGCAVDLAWMAFGPLK